VVRVALVAHVEVNADVHVAQVDEGVRNGGELVSVPHAQLSVRVGPEALKTRLAVNRTREVEANRNLNGLEGGRHVRVVLGNAQLRTVVLHAPRRRRRARRWRRRRGCGGGRGGLLVIVLVEDGVDQHGVLAVCSARAGHRAGDQPRARVHAGHGGATGEGYQEVVGRLVEVIVPDLEFDLVTQCECLVAAEDELGVKDGELLVDVHLGHVFVVLVVEQLALRLGSCVVQNARFDVRVRLPVRPVDPVGQAQRLRHYDLAVARVAAAVLFELLEVCEHGLRRNQLLGRAGRLSRDRLE